MCAHSAAHPSGGGRQHLYDPLGRRVSSGYGSWNGFAMERHEDGAVARWKRNDVGGRELTTIGAGQSRIQTVYAPGSFTPLVRIETDAAGRL